MKNIPHPRSLASACALRLFGCLTLTAALVATSLEASTWSGAGGTTDWSASGNWDIAPVGSDVLFNATGLTTGTTPTNVVDESLSISSLTYQYNHATQRQITEIVAGETLTVTGGSGPDALLVGGLASNTVSNETTAIIQGAGTLNINASGKNITIANHRQSATGYANPGKATLDLRGLAVLNVNLGATGSFNIGSNRSELGGADQGTKGVVYLAKDSTISAGALRVGAVSTTETQGLSSENPSELYFGANTVLNVNSIAVGVANATRAAGIMKFDPTALGSSPTLIIRAANGISAVSTFSVGITQAGTSSPSRGTVDFTGGDLDLLVTDLLIGSGRGTSATAETSNAIGVFTMDRGSVIATNVTVGRTFKGSAGIAVNTGTLNINGGSFTATNLTAGELSEGSQKAKGEVNIRGGAEVSVTNGVVLGKVALGTATDTITAILNVEDGTLTSGGNIGRGSASSFIDATLNLKGGSIDLTGHHINVDTLLLESGKLINVGEITSGTGVVKTTAGTLALEGTNNYTAATVVEAGTLRVNGALANSAVTIKEDATLTGSGGSMGATVTMESGSALAFDLRGGGDYDALAIQSLVLGEGVDLVIALDYAPVGGEAFMVLTGLSGGYTGAFATLNGAAFDPNAFMLNYGGEDYEFYLTYGGSTISLHAIPEPGTYALLGMAGLGLVLYRRKLIA